MTLFQRFFKQLPFALALLVVFGLFSSVMAAENNWNVAVVDMNRAINESLRGQASQAQLRTVQGQKQAMLQEKERELIAANQELGNSMMMTADARANLENKVRQMDAELRQLVQQAQGELQALERRLTQEIFAEIRVVVEQIAREQGLDFVIEKGGAQVILYSSTPFPDITDAVIQRYNARQ